jgi:hypothetical protein
MKMFVVNDSCGELRYAYCDQSEIQPQWRSTNARLLAYPFYDRNDAEQIAKHMGDLWRVTEQKQPPTPPKGTP